MSNNELHPISICVPKLNTTKLKYFNNIVTKENGNTNYSSRNNHSFSGTVVLDLLR
jgi:hypothetical protein